MSCKSWIFTLNNYTAAETRLLGDLECTYIVYGKEVGINGTHHLQGCVTFAKSKRLTALKKILGRAHWEEAKELEAARNYCMKDGDYTIRDNRVQGKRTDLQEVTDFIASGKTLAETAQQFAPTYVKYHQGLRSLAQLYKNPGPRRTKPIVYWFYGPTGTGKTRTVFERERDLWTSSGDLTYFNGYENQRAVVFDDFRGGFCKFRYLLRLLDLYPVLVNLKFGYTDWNPDRIYLTSNKHPERCYNLPDEDMGQLLRRIDCIIRFQAGGIQCVEKGEDVPPGPPPQGDGGTRNVNQYSQAGQTQATEIIDLTQDSDFESEDESTRARSSSLSSFEEDEDGVEEEYDDYFDRVYERLSNYN